MYGCTALPWIGPGRTSATWTVRSSRFSGRVRSRLCICARLSIWKTPTVSARLDLGVDRRVVERDPREVDRLAVDRARSARRTPRPPRASRARAGRSSGSRRRRTSPCPTGRSAGPPSRPGCTGTSSTSGRVEITIPPGCCEMWRGRPAISRVSSAKRPPARREQPAARASGSAASSSATLVGVPAVGDAGEPLELGERQPERLADVADRAARAVGGEARDERGVLAPVALGDADDQLLADVAREVEVDVRHRRQLAVEEAAEREVRARPGRRARGRSGSRRSSRPSEPRPRPGGRKRRGEPGPRTSSAISRASSSTSQWSRKKPARPSSSISASSSSSRAARAGRVTVCHLAGSAPRTRRRRPGELPDRGLVAVGEVGVAVAELLR